MPKSGLHFKKTSLHRRARKGLLVVAATAAVLLGLPIPGDAVPANDGNPDLPSTCGLDVSLILDRSGSIEDDEADLVRAAADTFATALVGTPSRLKVVTFADTATGVSAAGSNTATLGSIVFRDPALYTAPFAGAGNGGTNWDDGLETVRRSSEGPGKLVVFITDGDPTYRNQTEPNGHGTGIEGDGFNVSADNLDAAIDEADAIKDAGAHVFGIGVGLTTAAQEQRLNDVTGDEELTLDGGGNPNISFGQADYTIAPNFTHLQNIIEAFVRDLCAPSVNVTKFLQKADGTTVQADGSTPWQYKATVSPTPISWSAPMGASGASATQMTDANGGASFAWEPGVDDDEFEVDLAETGQGGWLYNGATCTLNKLDGSAPTVIFSDVGPNAPDSVRSVSQLENLSLDLNQAINCDVYNRQIRTATIQVTKQTLPAGRPETFDFELRTEPFALDTIDDLGHGQTGTFSVNLGGAFSIVEKPQPGFTQVSATCDNLGTTPVEAVSPQLLSVSEGSNWKCTFVNQADPGTIKVVKNADGFGADGTFQFASNVPDLGNFSLGTTNGTASTNTVAVPVGTYNITETNPAPWTLDNAECDNEDSPGQVTIDPGEDVVCTFTNHAPTPTINVTKTPDPGTVAEPGGTVTYSVSVQNTWVDDLQLWELTDSVEGGPEIDLTSTGGGVVSTTCATGQTIAAGQTYSCSFQMAVSGDAGDDVDDVVTATALAPDESEVTDTASAKVTVTDELPTISVTKTASAPTIEEPGGEITYTVKVTNNGSEPVEVTSISDSIEGGADIDVTTVAPPITSTTCALGGTIAGGGTYTCSFTVQQLANDSDSDDGDIDDTVSVTASDNEENTTSATASASVDIVDQLPTISVTKTPAPSTVQETGPEQTRSVTYTVAIQNTGTETVTIDSILDSVEGAPNVAVGGTCTDLLGTTLEPQAGTSCTFTGEVSGNEGESADDVVTVNASDDEGNQATDTAAASVGFTGVASSLSVTKTADPASVAEPGGDVTYTIGITNTSTTDTVTIGAITDVVDGGMPVAAVGTCPALIGTSLTPGQSTSCSFTLTVGGNAGDSVPDTVTVTGTDDDGDPVSASADEDVAITDVAAELRVTKTPSVDDVAEPGGPVTFTVLIENLSTADSVTIDSITDAIDSGAPAAAGGDCPSLIGTTLPPSGSATCTFVVQVSGNNGDSTVDTVEVTGTDDDGKPVDAEDSAVVDVTDSAATLEVTKTPSVEAVNEPGGPVTYTVGITNTSVADVLTFATITDVIGEEGVPFDVLGTCDDLIETTLAPGASTSCEFTLDVEGEDGDVVPDTVTVTAIDDDPPPVPLLPGAGPSSSALPLGKPVSASASAVVNILGVPPTGTVTKDADPTTIPEPGGPVDFDVTVTNTSATESVTVTSLTDTVDGNAVDITTVGGDVTATNCATGAVLAPNGGTYTCTFTLLVSGNAGDTVTDVISATLTDNDQETATPTDTEVVTVSDVLPSITVVKDNGGASLPAPGGDVDFDVTVTNTSIEDVTLTSLTDTFDGGAPIDVTTVAAPITATSCATGGVISANGGTYSCTFTATVSSDEAAQAVDTVDATAEDDEGNPATAGDDAVTEITASADVSVDKTIDGDLQVGETGTYELAIANAGPSTAVDVTVVDTLPAGLTATGASGDGWACAIADQAVTCERPSLAPGTSSVITITVDVGAEAEGQDLTNVAEVESSTDDPDDTNNRDEVTTLVPNIEPEQQDQDPPAVVPEQTPPPVVPGPLPRTGSEVERTILLGLGLALVGCGVLLTRRFVPALVVRARER